MIHNLWPTPIYRGRFDSTELVQTVLSEFNIQDPPGDLNEYNLFDSESKALNDLKVLAYNNFKIYILEAYNVDIDTYESQIKAWITGHGKNYSMSIHNHSGAHFSAVYYALAEEQDQGGQIVLSDPRSNANRGYDSKFKSHFKQEVIQPITGDYVIFPSFVYHHVNPFYSQFRIAIPIDLYLFED
jgi:hypothetical protein